MVQTEIINLCGSLISLKEENGSLYRDIKDIDVGGSHVLDTDPNATYREYVAVRQGSGDKVFLSSDACIDYRIIRLIVVDEVFTFEGTARSTDGTSTSTSTSTKPQNWLSRIVKKLWRGNSSLG